MHKQQDKYINEGGKTPPAYLSFSVVSGHTRLHIALSGDSTLEVQPAADWKDFHELLKSRRGEEQQP